MKHLILALALISPAIVLAAPVKIPPLKLCMKNSNGTIVAKKSCAGSETALSGAVLQGLAGIGPQGVPGTLDINKCFKREATASGVTVVQSTTACLVSEFIASSACNISQGIGIHVNEELIVADNTLLGTQAYGILRCTGADVLGSGQAFSVRAQALCCRP